MTPTWQLTIETKDTAITPGRTLTEWVVRGSGEKPTLQDLSPPVVVPPPPPPASDPFASQLGEDTSPFNWPLGGPTVPVDASDRQYPLGLHPPVKWWFSANLSNAGRPLTTYRWAGIIAQSARTDYEDQPAKEVGGMNLWVLDVPDFEDPLTGIHYAPPPGYLIRRALARGRITP